MEERKNNVPAIKKFFEADGGRKVTMEELKLLTNADREELGELAASAIRHAEERNALAEADCDENSAGNESDAPLQDNASIT
jgi:hypothetical protein